MPKIGTQDNTPTELNIMCYNTGYLIDIRVVATESALVLYNGLQLWKVVPYLQQFNKHMDKYSTHLFCTAATHTVQYSTVQPYMYTLFKRLV